MNLIATSLLACAIVLPTAARAQPAQEPDPNCPLKQGSAKAALSAGRITILTTKNPGSKDCTSAGMGCKLDVEVASFKRATGGADACCTRVEWGTLNVVKRNKNVPLTWKLKPADPPPNNYNYVFNPNAVYIINPPPTPADFDPLTIEVNKKSATLVSVNGRPAPEPPVSFNYGVSVSRKLNNGQYLACDANDPVSVNNGN